MKIKSKKNNKININQKSFYFEDYFEGNLKQKRITKDSISNDRIYILFFSFLSLIFILSIKIIFLSIQEPQFSEIKNNSLNFKPLRRDFIDRNGIIISRNIKAYHAAVKPNLIKDKNNFLLNVKINFPNISTQRIKKKLSEKKYFYLKKD